MCTEHCAEVQHSKDNLFEYNCIYCNYIYGFALAHFFAAVLSDWVNTHVKSLQCCLHEDWYWLVLQPHSTHTNHPPPQAVA